MKNILETNSKINVLKMSNRTGKHTSLCYTEAMEARNHPAKQEDCTQPAVCLIG